MDANWNKLYDAARAVLNPREISEKIAAGGVAAAVFFGVLMAIIFKPKDKR